MNRYEEKPILLADNSCVSKFINITKKNREPILLTDNRWFKNWLTERITHFLVFFFFYCFNEKLP